MMEVELITATGNDYRSDNSLATLCPAAQEFGDQESGKPRLIADNAQEHKHGNQTDEDYLLLYSTSRDSPD